MFLCWRMFIQRKEFKFKRLYKFLNIQAPAEKISTRIYKKFSTRNFFKNLKKNKKNLKKFKKF